ncbi:leucine-rich PPR motif-containing protein, mitochondrial [Brachyhypopomus gauderio]|uniref:leucine-rich PPR motif-containing protein, mitochondrial n=1 Tax=Brachyhypopomus gauderio TaxID=698409 RepID=UPI004041FE34
MPFSTLCRSNMAALLRSTRVLRSASSPLLRVTGTRHHGRTVGRFCGGAAGAGRVAVCCGQATRGWSHVHSLLPCGSARPCLGTRFYGAAAEQKGASEDDSSTGVRTSQAQQFDWALAKLDSSVRRTGRVTKTLLQRIFHDICRKGYPSGNQALLLLRSCGSLLPELPLAERTEFAHHIWEKLLELGATYDASHYNALLKVYLQNEFKFSPTEFLAKMEAANVQPNRVTYQRLIAAYCQVGDIEGASKILGFMKSKDLPITEAVFDSLVTGHSRAGDMQSAVNILSVMRSTGVDPGPDTYLALLVAYAEQGDLVKIKETLNAAENADVSLTDRDLMQVVFSLTRAGYQQHVSEVMERLRHDRGFVPDAMNLCLSLVTQGHEHTAFLVLKSFPSMQADAHNGDTPDQGNFFLRHCVNMDKSPEVLVGFCKDLKDSNLHATPLQFTLYCALESKKTDMVIGLMKAMKEEGLPIRPHYFWPLLTQHQRDKNTTGTLEVLKAMQELGVLPDMDTLSNYVLPTFPSMDNACSALKDAGLAVDTECFFSAEVHTEAITGNLSRLFALLSSPSLPATDPSALRGSLNAGFRRSKDVENMANITELLYKDVRLSQTDTAPAENMAYFLYNLFDGMTESEVKSKEGVLREYLHQLQHRGIIVPVNIYRGIRNILVSYHVPELIKDVLALVDSKESLRSTDIPSPSGSEDRFSLQKMLEKLKTLETSGDKVMAAQTFKRLISALCTEEDMSRALELKAEHEDKMSTSCYALLINLCCRHDNPEEALNLKRELARKDSEAVIDSNKYLALVKVLVKHKQLEEAVDILKEMKEKDVTFKDNTASTFFHMLNASAMEGDVATIRRLQETVFTLGLTTPSTNLCSPLVTAHLEKGDLAGALEATMECHKQYNRLPRIHDILCGLVEKGDTDLLQKAMDFVSQERGEMTMLYDLFFAFLQTGRYREARRIIETPGLRARPGRLQWYAEKCVTNQQMETLENMVDLTAKLFECDRDELYHYLLRLCKDTNDWRKADAVWTKMQEENVIPRERTLRLLADILKSNNQEVPFEVPEIWYEQPEAKEHQRDIRVAVRGSAVTELSPNEYQLRVLALSKKGKVQEAYSVLKEADRKGLTLSPICYDSLVKSLLAAGRMEDAIEVKDMATNRIPGFQMSDMANSLYIVTQAKQDRPQDALASLKSMLQMDQVPSNLAITRLVQTMGSHGDTKGIQEVESLIKTLGPSINLSSMVFTNNMALAQIKNGDIESAVETLESLFTQGDDSSRKNISFVFRKVLEAKNSEALDKLRALAERLCNHFAKYSPATELFLQYLDLDMMDEAKHLLQRCGAVAEQKDALLSYMAKTSQNPGQVAKIKNLCELIPDFTEKELIFNYLMKCHAVDKDLESAKSLYQRMQQEEVQINELSLKRLAQLYKQADEAVPFEEPPESFTFYADKLKASTSSGAEDH